MRIVFLGTGEIGIPTLRWLVCESGHEVVAVICQPDKPVGRGRRLTPPETKSVALEHRVPVWQPEAIREIVPNVKALVPDVIVVVAYGQFLPRSVREATRLACVNLHASLLPRWRGASPIQSAIAAGDVETGVTVMYVEQEMDAGDIVLAEATAIDPTATGRSLQARLADLAPRALGRALPMLASGTAPRMAQDPALVTHCAKLTREHGRIIWARPAVELERLIRAYDPWPGTHTSMPDGRNLKVFPPVAIGPSLDAAPGTVVQAAADTLVVAAGDGSLVLNEVQIEGHRRLNRRDFLAGSRLAPGSRLGGI
jgi:methionyl-tRNA formyltransferase